MFSKNLKYLRQKKGLEQIELANIFGKKSASTISEWESGKYTPKIGTLAKIASYFDVDLDDLMNIDLENRTLDTPTNTIISDIANKVTQLQPPRQKIVLDTATTQLEEQKAEEKKLEELKAKKKKQEENKTTKVQAVKEPATTYKTERKRIRLKTYPFLLDVANAGNGHGDEYQYVEGMKAPFCDGADFIMKVSGDSMYPTFEHGDYVYIKKTIELYPGDIGIFLSDNTYYIKEYSQERLISHNREFDDIYPDEFNDIYKIGKVLGKVDFDKNKY